MRVSGWIIYGLLVSGAIYVCMTQLLVLVVVLIFAVLLLVASAIDAWRERTFGTKTIPTSICTFAREFDCRAIDTWIIRAVFDEFSKYSVQSFRADENILVNLKVDSEDFEDIVFDVAERTGRSMDDYESNPFYDRITTVRGLVNFFVNQPKLA